MFFWGRRGALCGRRGAPPVLAAIAVAVLALGVAPVASASPQASVSASVAASVSNRSQLAKAVAYLVAPANLVDGHYYAGFGSMADWGLTLDGAFALAASGLDDPALKRLTEFLDHGGRDPGGQSINDWTGIGTDYVSGGALGKQALLAQITGYDPHNFAGHDVLRALEQSVCAHSTVDGACAAKGNYRYSSSVFAQSLGVVADVRAGRAAAAAAPIGYLQDLQNTSGAWPSLIPSAGNDDVDSTAIAVMALDLVHTGPARAAVRTGLAWLAGQQSRQGGFAGVDANSVNSTALAIQALSLNRSAYAAPVAKALRFVLSQQNRDGGFNVSPTTTGSDLRSSAQAVSGLPGTSFGRLSEDISGVRIADPTRSIPVPTTSARTTTRPTSARTTLPSPSARTSARTLARPTASLKRTALRRAAQTGSVLTGSTLTGSTPTGPTLTGSSTAPLRPTSAAASQPVTGAQVLANTGAPVAGQVAGGTLLVSVGLLALIAGRPRRPWRRESAGRAGRHR